MPTLILSNGNAFNPLELDLSQYLDLTPDSDLDPQNPAFSNKVISHSLLKEGGVLALEDFQNKMLVFPLQLSCSGAAAVNEVPEPSFEYDTAGSGPAAWTTSLGAGWSHLAAGATLTVSGAQARYGSQSLQVATGAIVNEGAGIALGTLLAGTYTYSVWLKGNAGGEAVQLVAGNNSGSVGQSGTLSTSWQQLTVTFTADGTDPCFVTVRGTAASAITFFMDAAMVVAGSTLPAYFDGGSLGCSWSGQPGNSVSVAPGGSSQLMAMIAEINQVITAPGATFSWQDDGLSQPTIFDGISGEFDIKYSYRQSSSPGHLAKGELKLYTEPFGHTAGPRPYAAASGIGPLLMISPYASGGALAISPSATGFGGSPGALGPNGASGGISYWSSPRLAGDAPALLQVSYVGPQAVGATNNGTLPFAAVSLLPDASYQPLITAAELVTTGVAPASSYYSSDAVASQYLRAGSEAGRAFQVYFSPIPAGDAAANWAGNHRLLAIARASGIPGTLTTFAGPLTPNPTVASVSAFDWGLYDLGTVTLRASEPPATSIYIRAVAGAQGAPTTAVLDLTAVVMLPDNATWFLNPRQVQPAQYGYANGEGNQQPAPYTNTVLLDDTLGDQFVYWGGRQAFAPSPLGAVASSARITQYTRGLVPRPDPKNGLPIVAILGVGQNYTPALLSTPATGGSWANPQNLRTMAQVNVLDRAKYVLP